MRDHPRSGKLLNHPLGEASVLEALVGLLDKVKWLWEEVKQQGKWIFSGLEVLPVKLKEERIYIP